jgi:hypothetical protein
MWRSRPRDGPCAPHRDVLHSTPNSPGQRLHLDNRHQHSWLIDKCLRRSPCERATVYAIPVLLLLLSNISPLLPFLISCLTNDHTKNKSIERNFVTLPTSAFRVCSANPDAQAPPQRGFSDCTKDNRTEKRYQLLRSFDFFSTLVDRLRRFQMLRLHAIRWKTL